MTIFRTLSTAITCLAVTAVIFKTAHQPQAQQPSYQPFSFPDIVPLEQWQTLTTDQSSLAEGRAEGRIALLSNDLSFVELSSTAAFSGNISAQQQYQYQQKTHQLTIDARYLTHTNGNIKGLITELVLGVSITDKNHYTLTSHNGRAYLNTCQSAYGSATFTTDQFNRNHLAYGLSITRVLPWLQGKITLLDQRCLWTQISVPLVTYESQQEAYAAIESAWLDWSSWWENNFPSS